MDSVRDDESGDYWYVRGWRPVVAGGGLRSTAVAAAALADRQRRGRGSTGCVDGRPAVVHCVLVSNLTHRYNKNTEEYTWDDPAAIAEEGEGGEGRAKEVPQDVAAKLAVLADLTAGKFSKEVMLDTLRSASGNMDVQAAANALYAQPDGATNGRRRRRRRPRRLSRRPSSVQLEANSSAVASTTGALKQVVALTNDEKNGRRRRARRPSVRDLESKAAEVLASHKDERERFSDDVLAAERDRQRKLMEKRRRKKRQRSQRHAAKEAEEARLPPIYRVATM